MEDKEQPVIGPSLISALPEDVWEGAHPALKELILLLLGRVEALEVEVRELRSRLNQDSSNSSKPPSSDPPWRLYTFHHSGFNCHRGGKVEADDRDARERLARYIIRAPLSLQKLTYVPEEGKLTYDFGRCGRDFHPLEFLAELTQHIPDPYEHRVFYYGAHRVNAEASKPREKLSQCLK